MTAVAPGARMRIENPPPGKNGGGGRLSHSGREPLPWTTSPETNVPRSMDEKTLSALAKNCS